MSNYIKYIREYVGSKPIVMVGGTVIVINEQEEILMTLRVDNNTWCFPGGAFEMGETTEETAKRELYEETGLIANELKLFGVFSGEKLHYTYPNGDEVYIVDVLYTCRDYSGELKVQESEVEDIKFFSIDSLPENINSPTKASLDEYVKSVKSRS